MITIPTPERRSLPLRLARSSLIKKKMTGVTKSTWMVDVTMAPTNRRRAEPRPDPDFYLATHPSIPHCSPTA